VLHFPFSPTPPLWSFPSIPISQIVLEPYLLFSPLILPSFRGSTASLPSFSPQLPQVCSTLSPLSFFPLCSSPFSVVFFVDSLSRSSATPACSEIFLFFHSTHLPFPDRTSCPPGTSLLAPSHKPHSPTQAPPHTLQTYDKGRLTLARWILFSLSPPRSLPPCPSPLIAVLPSTHLFHLLLQR